MMLPQIFFIAGLCVTANAFVNYGDSALYDEYDLSLYKSFPLPECLAASCKVYVSAPESSLPTLEKVYLGDTSLATLARQSNNTTGLKTPYTLKPYSGKNFITNLNWKFATAPVAVYVVYQRATFFSTALVYEPTITPLTVQWSNSSTLTVLSATNFTVDGAVKDGSLAFGRVLAGGYDVAQRNWAKTPALYEFSPISKSFDFSVSGPLATLYSFNPVEAEVTIQNGVQVSTSSPRAFVTSPGYTGAISGQVYRSSLYNKTVQYRFNYEKEVNIHFKAYLNTFADSVEVTVNGDEKINLRGTRGLSSYHQIFSAKAKDLLITFTKSSDFSSFLLRTEVSREDQINSAVDALKEKVLEKVEEKKEEIREKVEEKKEKIKDQIEAKVEEKKAEVEQEIADKVDEIERDLEEKKEELEEKIQDVLNEVTLRPGVDVSSEIDEIKEAFRKKVEEKKEEVEEKEEEKKEELKEEIEEAKDNLEEKKAELEDQVEEKKEEIDEKVQEKKDDIERKIQERLAKVSARPRRFA